MTEHDRRNDPVRELAELLAVMRTQTQSTDQALRRVEHNRLNLLVVHAVAGLLISWLMMASKPTLVGPAWKYLSMIPFFPYSFAGILLLGGLILLPGAIGRIPKLEIPGLWILYLWYLALAIGFIIPSLEWAVAAVPAWWYDRPLPTERPTFYPWVAYLHLAIIMRVHIWTLRRLSRDTEAREKVFRAQAEMAEERRQEREQ